MRSPTAVEPLTLARIRRFLLGTLLIGVTGMGTELLFLGHIDGVLQLIPVTLLATGMVSLAWLALAPGPTAIRAVRVLMAVFVASGIVGVGLHLRGNLEFELEMYPNRAGAALLRKTLTGATPVLAPGSMALLGLVGLALTYHHPALERREAAGPAKEASS
jgi:hypothetical protein